MTTTVKGNDSKQSIFAEGERVLCFHGPLIYDAKCVQIRNAKDGTIEYLIHYAGWKKSWDEWVSSIRILKYNEQNLTRQRELADQHKDAKKVRCKASLSAASSENAAVAIANDGSSFSYRYIDTTTIKTEDGKPLVAVASSDKAVSSTLGDVEGGNSLNRTKRRRDAESGESLTNQSGDNEADVPTLRPKRRRDTEVGEPSSGLAGDAEVDVSSLRPKRRRDAETAETTTSQSVENETLPTKKKQTEHGVQSEEDFQNKVEIKVKIPDELKPWLVDDWEIICRQKKLYLLPAKTTVDNIIENYIQMKTSNFKNLSGPFKESASVQTANSLKEYFNATLGSQLLYDYERVQYSQILEKYPNRPMSSIYGAAHLLRLFVILGGLIIYTQANEKTIQVLKCQLHDFLKYLIKNISNLFSIQFYEYTTPEYHRMSKTAE